MHDDFLCITPTAQEINWDYVHFNVSAQLKKTITRLKRQPTKWKKICTRYLSEKRLISKIYSELK
jgi:hypothetical protein